MNSDMFLFVCNDRNTFVILPENAVDFAVDIVCLSSVHLTTASIAHRRMIGPHLGHEGRRF
jgi:hypothetical protein